MNDQAIYPIRAVSAQTGLSAHVIRAWERRYGAIHPTRTATQRRLYSLQEIERLKLLKQAIHAGHNIAQLAALSDRELTTLLVRMTPAPMPASDRENARSITEPVPPGFVSEALEALRNLDSTGFERILDQACLSLPRSVVLQQVVLPLMQQIGVLWAGGEFKIVSEHLGSTILRQFLWELLRSTESEANSPLILGATPVGQWHELGALMAMVIAADAGWQVLYCGANLPAEEIASAAVQKSARAVALSVVLSSDVRFLIPEMKRLQRFLPPDCTLILGGQGARNLAAHLESDRMRLVQNLADLNETLQDLLAW